MRAPSRRSRAAAAWASPEMTGSPNLTIVPDPATFRVLPWAPGVGWILCDEYFNSGVPFHFSPRHLLRRQLRRLPEKGMGYVVGLEVEWYLLRVDGGSPHRRAYRRARHARPSGRTGAAGARLFLSFRIQHGPDAAGAQRAGGGVREDRPAAALGRERMGPGPGRMHLCGRRCAHRRRQSAAVSHRDPADLPPHGPFRDLHVPAGTARATIRAAGICISR